MNQAIRSLPRIPLISVHPSQQEKEKEGGPRWGAHSQGVEVPENQRRRAADSVEAKVPSDDNSVPLSKLKYVLEELFVSPPLAESMPCCIKSGPIPF